MLAKEPLQPDFPTVMNSELMPPPIIVYVLRMGRKSHTHAVRGLMQELARELDGNGVLNRGLP